MSCKVLVPTVIVCTILLISCGFGGVNAVNYQELNHKMIETTEAPVKVNNCGGKSDISSVIRFSIEVAMEASGDIGFDIKALRGSLLAKYSISETYGQEIVLPAPAETNMEYNRIYSGLFSWLLDAIFLLLGT